MTVYIHGGFRTPIGVLNGQYKSVRPEILGAELIKYIMRHCETANDTDGLFCGNAVGTGGNIARLTALSAGIPASVPAVTVDMQCASALMSVEIGYAHIKAGIMNTVLAGGIESSSLQPVRRYAPGDDRTGEYKVAQFSPYELSPTAMLEGAERTMKKHGVTAEHLAPHIIRSHRLAVDAMENERFASYIMPYSIENRPCRDESIRPKMSENLLHRMKPLLGEGTLTTAGNACLTHDGAAFAVLSNRPGPFAIRHIMPWAGDPLYSPEGAWGSTQLILKTAGLTMDDMDAVEWNEAFAVIDELFSRNYPSATDRYNIWGGALAYGHPYGCSGAVLLLHCMAALEEVRGRFGLCAIAGAGGTGTSIIIERL